MFLFLQESKSSLKIGYMYEFDCKPVLKEPGLNTLMWQAVAFEHNVIKVIEFIRKKKPGCL